MDHPRRAADGAMAIHVERSAGRADDRRLEELAEDGRHVSLDGERDRRQERGHPFRKRVGFAHARRRALPASLSLLRAASLGVLVAAATCATSRPTVGSFEKVPTATLPREARVFVLAPPSWPRQAGRRYPVLFFLHEIYGSGGSLASHGLAAELSARMRDGRLPEFFVVAPSAPAAWFSDSHDGRYRYEKFLTEDLIAWVERRYPVIPASRARGVTGISMGGYGAMKIALKRPNLYGSVSALSGALIPFDWSEDLRSEERR